MTEPCGQIIGHGERCGSGWLCSDCKERSRIAAQMNALREALVDLLHAVCGEKGFAEAVRRDSGRIYPWPALELAEAKALAALGRSK